MRQETPRGFGVRQSPAAFYGQPSARGLAQSKTLARSTATQVFLSVPICVLLRLQKSCGRREKRLDNHWRPAQSRNCETRLAAKPRVNLEVDNTKQMRPGQISPNEFECAILEKIARDEPLLKGPFNTLHVLSRKYTGVGSFTDFVCNMPKAASDCYLGLKPLIRLPGVPNGIGAVVWCQGCQPEHLELFTYGDDLWDGTYEGFYFEESTAKI